MDAEVARYEWAMMWCWMWPRPFNPNQLEEFKKAIMNEYLAEPTPIERLFNQRAKVLFNKHPKASNWPEKEE